VLTGKYRTGTPADSRGASPAYAGYVEQHRTDRAARIVQAVVTAADGLGTSPLCVALAWVRDRPGVVAPVVGARDTGQLTGSLAAEEITLPPAIKSALDDVSAIECGYPERWPE
jgi:aryl-alcohol dehydrogenase-like predicted oxidoreductase